MRRLGQDLSAAAQTAENIRDAFGALHKVSFHLQGQDPAAVADSEQIRFFCQTTREVFSKWAYQMNEVSTQIVDQHAKFFQHFASQGERIGAITQELLSLDK